MGLGSGAQRGGIQRGAETTHKAWRMWALIPPFVTPFDTHHTSGKCEFTLGIVGLLLWEVGIWISCVVLVSAWLSLRLSHYKM